MTPAIPSLRTVAAKSAAWYGATRVWAQLTSWAITVVLARWLTPQDYGLFAIALSVLTVLELLQEFGLGTAIIQRQDLIRRQLNGVFWVVTGTSVVLTLGVVILAEGIGNLYGEARLTWVLRLLALTFLLNSLGTVPYSLLTKALDLRRRSVAEAGGITASALTAVSLAYLGYGVWALVWGHVARAVVLNGLLSRFAGWRPGLDSTTSGLAGILAFGLRISGGQMVGSASLVLNTGILARLLGATSVGLYAMGQSIAEGPHRVTTAIINQLSLPIFSRFQSDPAALRHYYLQISRYLAVVSLPVQIGLALVAAELVAVLLSDTWKEIVWPLRLFCIEGVLVVSTLSCSPLLTARGRAALLLNRSVLSMLIMSAATVAGAQFGLVGVGVARIVAVLPLRLTLLFPALQELDLRLGEYVGVMQSCFWATGIMAGVVILAHHVLPFPAGSVGMLAGKVCVGAVAYGLAVVALDRSLGAEIVTITRDVVSPSKA
jgi:O-antigen/teichoic acid export membrane protein